MSASPPFPHEDPLQPSCERVCTALVEDRWRAHPGLALRIGRDSAGVLERPGRTRFDLEFDPATGLCAGLLRTRAPALPFADASLALVLIDRVGLPAATLRPLLDECMRVLASEGCLLLLDYSPLGWLAWRRRLRGERLAPGAGVGARCLRAAGFDNVEVQRSLRWPPLPASVLARLGAKIERGHGWPAPASLHLVSARKRSSNVIAIPFARDRRSALVAAPEGMRRAG